MTVLELAHYLLHQAANHPDGIEAGAAMPVVLSDSDGTEVHIVATAMLPARNFTYTHTFKPTPQTYRAVAPAAIVLSPGNEELITRTRVETP